MAAYYLRPEKKYKFQVVNLTGDLRPVLGTKRDYLILCLPENSYSHVASFRVWDLREFSVDKVFTIFFLNFEMKVRNEIKIIIAKSTFHNYDPEKPAEICLNRHFKIVPN